MERQAMAEEIVPLRPAPNKDSWASAAPLGTTAAKCASMRWKQVQTAGMAKNKRRRNPKTVLKLPDLEQSKSAVLTSLTSRSSQRSYDHAIREFIDWYCSEPRLAFNKTVVTRYRISLEQAQYASSTINLRLAAIRRLAYEAADCGLLSPDLAAGIRRVKGVKKHGMRIGNWLTAEQGKRLLAVFDHGDLRNRRDYARGYPGRGSDWSIAARLGRICETVY
jgi:hypothetical protein